MSIEYLLMLSAFSIWKNTTGQYVEPALTVPIKENVILIPSVMSVQSSVKSSPLKTLCAEIGNAPVTLPLEF